MKEALNEQKTEEDDQERRDRNIIIFRAAEAKDTVSKNRIEYDRKFFQEMCTEALGIGPIDVEETTRFGKPNQEKPRPLRIKLKDRSDKLNITAKLRNLGKADDKFRGISVSDDMSKKEREEVRLLTQQAKNWRETNKAEPWKFRVRGTPGAHWIQWIKLNPTE